MGTHQIKPTECPHCKIQLKHLTNLDPLRPAAPQPHDLTVCDNCGFISLLDENLLMTHPPVSFEIPALIEMRSHKIRTSQQRR